MYKTALSGAKPYGPEKIQSANLKLLHLRNLNQLLYLFVYLLLYIELAFILILLIRSLQIPIFLGSKFSIYPVFLASKFSSYPIFCVAIITLVLFYRKVKGLKQIDLQAITFRLDHDFPILEESTTLLLKPYATLNTLERIQASFLVANIAKLPLFLRIVKSFYLQYLLAALLLIVLVILYRPIIGHENQGRFTQNKQIAIQQPLPKSIIPIAQLQDLRIDILQPFYTKRLPTTQTRADLKFIEGAQITWDLVTTSSAQKVQLIINGVEVVKLIPDKGRLHWQVSKKMDKAGFYQFKIENNLSSYYKLEAIKDLPPVIHILAPGQYTLLSPGFDKSLTVKAEISDDFGLSSVMLLATVASGGGESVKFRQFQLPLLPAFSGEPLNITLHRALDLKSLHIGGSDELFFYLSASDNHGLKTRSAMLYLNFRDTSRQSEVSGLVKGLNPVPEYFRSERQLIIDTEKLLKDKKLLGLIVFKEKSNDLGIDQQLLRQRYSKFLGEESSPEEMLPGANLTSDQSLQPVASSKTSASEVFTEKPDNAEDADIFEPVIKAELKAALDQMWLAERMLRTYKLAEARPYEYSALRLLKLVQQKTRAYVSKTSFKPTEMQPFVKRLSGEQSQISNHSFSENDQQAPPTFLVIKQVIPILEKIKESVEITSSERTTLERAGAVLGEQAIAQPGFYLPALSAMHHLLSGDQDRYKYPGSGVNQLVQKIEQACLKLIPEPQFLPGSTPGIPFNPGLSKFYFNTIPQEK